MSQVCRPESSSAASLEQSNVYEMIDMFPAGPSVSDPGAYKKPKPSIDVVTSDTVYNMYFMCHGNIFVYYCT